MTLPSFSLTALLKKKRILFDKVNEKKEIEVNFVHELIEFLEKNYFANIDSAVLSYKNAPNIPNPVIIECMHIIYYIEIQENIRLIQSNPKTLYFRINDFYQEAYDTNLLNIAIQKDDSLYSQFRLRQAIECCKLVYTIVKTFINDDKAFIYDLDSLFLSMISKKGDATLQVAEFLDYLRPKIYSLEDKEYNISPNYYGNLPYWIIGSIVFGIVLFIIYSFNVSRNKNNEPYNKSINEMLGN